MKILRAKDVRALRRAVEAAEEHLAMLEDVGEHQNSETGRTYTSHIVARRAVAAGERALERLRIAPDVRPTRYGHARPVFDRRSIVATIADGLDAAVDGRGWDVRHERARKIADNAPAVIAAARQLLDDWGDGKNLSAAAQRLAGALEEVPR